MRRRLFSGLVIGLTVLLAVLAWRQWGARRAAPREAASSSGSARIVQAPETPMRLLSRTETLAAGAPGPEAELTNASPLKYRLTNSRLSVGQLARSDKAILLENALLDTSSPDGLNIPAHLQAQGDPGTYIVQSRGAITADFRADLRAAGASILSYIPNNAFLVRASRAGAEQLKSAAQAVLPYEPYYKIKAGLLGLAVKRQPMPEGMALNVLLFDDAGADTEEALADLGVTVLARDASPFGTVLRIAPPADSLAALARLPGVQEIERARTRIPANDLSRMALGISTDSVTSNSYLSLMGSNIWVNINDTGVDTNHPDLQTSDGSYKVLFDTTNSAWDAAGHGTFVAGIIAGTGAKSTTITNAQGSIMPATNGQFRGKAPAAHLYSLSGGSDAYLQQRAASQTNVFISNNSWTYGDSSYDLAAASYDAAVRDALPLLPGSQPLLYVFPSGNGGAMNAWDDDSYDGGTGGSADTIQSPGTAKNVITVGAIEQKRGITNVVIYSIGTNADGTTAYATNQQWLPSTDSSLQVAGFSGRGNVGIGTEGDSGRFKPDVVAPGTAVVSIRSTQWDQGAYYNPTSYLVMTLIDVVLQTNSLYRDYFPVPSGAVSASLTVSSNANSPSAFANLPLYIRFAGYPTTNLYDFKTTNNPVNAPGDLPLSPLNANWYFAVRNPSTSSAVQFDMQIVVALTNQHGDFLTSLSNLNQSIGPYYRYESGTSLAAAEASGTLALMEEFLEQRIPGRFSWTNRPSPALMKAMLINGSRSLSSAYDFQVANSINYQGWGLINLPNSLSPLLSNSVSALSNTSTSFVFDQSPGTTLSTGQRHTRYVSVSPGAQTAPLRVTLVWTDPPGNPMAGVKLVNDLDLLVTNLDTGEVFVGNDLLSGQRFNGAWDTNSPIVPDVVNNVENVYLQGPLGSNYSVTVVGSRVNVNAVTVQTNDIVQDYALVISSMGTDTNSLTLFPTNGFYLSAATNLIPLVTTMTNQFASSSNISGGILTGQHAGANSPLLGTNSVPVANTVDLMGPIAGQITLGQSNQWHFYVLTNENDWNNAAFLTFDPQTLSVPREGVFVADNTNATRAEADVDLYVSTDPDLTNLTVAAVSAAYKSLTRGGTETIVLTNAESHHIYYIGVKSEDEEAAEYGFMGVFSPNPFGDGLDNPSLIGFPAPAPIPDGSPQNPGGVRVFAVCVSPKLVRQVIVTNEVSHQLIGDLLGLFKHNRITTVLNNHSPDGNVVNRYYIYDDSGEKNVSIPGGTSAPDWGVYRSDGPGTLNDFRVQPAAGQWQLTMIDNALGHIGTNESLGIKIYKMDDLTLGTYITLSPGACWDGFVDVPADVTNLTVTATIQATNSLGPVDNTAGPITLTVCPANDSGCLSDTVSGTNSTASVTFDQSTSPSINADIYNVQVCNNGSVEVTVFVKATLIYDINGVAPVKVRASGVTPILDDAVTYSAINVTNDEKISSMSVGVRIDHPRVSDLVMHLISPKGKRYLLDENRGGTSTNGMGSTLVTTRIEPVTSDGDWHAQTNIVDTGVTSGTITIDYDFYTVPDFMNVYYQGTLLWASGMRSGSGTTNLTFGPGASTQVEIIMNEGGNTNNPTTAWTYTVTSTRADYMYFTFTEDTNLTVTPVKFAPPPFTPSLVPITNALSDFESLTNGIYYATNLTSVTLEGWSVLTNSVLVTNTPAANTGTNYLDLQQGIIRSTLPTVQDHTYTLTFAYQVNSGLGAQVLLNHETNNITGPTVGWKTNLYSFTAIKSGTPIVITPLSGGSDVWLDSFTLVDKGGPMYVLAEDSLSDIRYSKAKGNWQLELWDDRAGATNPTPQLLSWQLEFLFSRHPLQAVPLVHRGTISNYLAAGSVNYFSVDVPSWAHYATNWLTNASGPLNVYFNQNNLASATNGPGDVAIMVNQTSYLTNLSAGSTPPLAPGQTYYLAIANTNATPVVYQFEVDFDVTDLTPVPGFADSVSYSSTLFAGDGPRFFSYDCATNVTMLQFRLFNLTGNADMVIRKGLPFPDLNSYDYAGKNLGTNEEEVQVFFNSDAGLNAGGGRYYIGVYNVDTTNVAYTLQITAFTNPIPKIIPLANGVPYANTNYASSNAQDYYSYVVTANELAVSFVLTNLSANVDLVLTKGLPLPDATNYAYGSFNSGTNVERIIVTPTTGPIPLSPGVWYAAVTNVSGVDAAYTILVTDFIRPGTVIIPLTNDVLYANTNVALYNSPDFYRYTVSSNATSVLFELTNLSANVNLIARRGPPPPTLAGYDYGSFNPGTIMEEILVLTNSSPVPLAPGDWYLSVYNASGVNASYQILASEATHPVVTNSILTLTNTIPYVSTNYASSNAVDYYRYVVTTNEFGKIFKLYALNGNANLIVKRGLPLPTPVAYNYGSFNPGTNDELIQVFTNSSPVPLSPGDWYLGVINADTNNVAYTILVTDYVLPTNIVALTNGVAYTAVNPGGLNPNDYYSYDVSTNAVRVQFEIDNPSANMALSTHFGLPIPGLTNFDYFSDNPGTNLELITILTNSSPAPLMPGTWFLTALNLSGQPVTYSIKATEWAVTGYPVIITPLNTDTNGFCLSWNSLNGAYYYIQARVQITDSNWTTYAALQATNDVSTYCIPLPSVYHFFRVGEGFATNSPLLSLQPAINSISAGGGTVTIKWTSIISKQFKVQWADSLATPTVWNTIDTPITSDTGFFQFTDDGSVTAPMGPRRFYRLVQTN